MIDAAFRVVLLHAVIWLPLLVAQSSQYFDVIQLNRLLEKFEYSASTFVGKISSTVFQPSFSADSVSAQICETDLLEGQSCIIKLEKKSAEMIYKLEWIFTSFIDTKTYKSLWRNGKTINNIPDATIQSDGSLRLQNVKLDNTGEYKYETYDGLAKDTKPNVKFTCDGETATLTCDIQMKDKKDITWVQDMKGEHKINLTLTSKQTEENAEYSCRVQNPVSIEQSDVKTVSLSGQICEKNLLEGNSCIIKLEKKSGETISNTEWIFTSSIDNKIHKAQQKAGKTINNIPDATIQSDGSLKLQNVKLNNTGKYKYEIYDDKGTKAAGIEKEITVYAKVTKPNVKLTCDGDTATLTCDFKIKDKRDLTITWIQGKQDMKGENKPNLIRTSKQIEENADYSCRVHNPVSNEQSDVKTISCKCGGHFNSARTIFGVDLWLMVGILAGGGALLITAY
ncbi:cell adhesion molecule CEACAM2-like [Misgurnus anguillicaudatus]|uniref:cell adhesion molecule CEACAM2-like n=1 Tax=Misgurnus anguillicaudatus TaxID=75329 RepID=UPI003CCF0F5C